jgi:phosphotransferase system enzyme I (PtsI)
MINGIPASSGYAVGRAVLKKEPDLKNAETNFGVEVEKKRFLAAIEKTSHDIGELIKSAESSGKKDAAGIIGSQLAFLKDPEILEPALDRISKGTAAQKAITDVTNEMADEFDSFDDGYIKERSADIRDVGERIAKNIAGVKELGLSSLPYGTILVAHELKPSDTAQIDKNNVLAFVTENGGRTCHTAIMARSMGLAAVVGADGATEKIKDGDTVIIDGTEGLVFVNPGKAVLDEYNLKIDNDKKQKLLYASVKDKRCVDASGHRINIFANIGSPAEAEAALENGAEGIGLFRTEFLFLDKTSMPSEDGQFEVYKKTAQAMGGRPVIIRTADIGGDKNVPFLRLPKEDNPFLGCRAIRLCFKYPEMFKAQLRAILRASAFGDLRIMFPMISGTEELKAAKKILRECMDELKAKNIKFNEKIPTGIMVEIPSAAITAGELAKESDFFSIGTNDLTQYTLAADRMNQSVSYIYDPMNNAVMELIRTTIAAAHENGITCGMCGELASKPEAMSRLLGFGLDEFSMSAGSIPKAKLTILGMYNGKPQGKVPQ